MTSVALYLWVLTAGHGECYKSTGYIILKKTGKKECRLMGVSRNMNVY